MLTFIPTPQANALFLTRQIRAIEQRAFAQPQPPDLMERAGLATAELARELIGERGDSVLVFAGPGNNGGDAFVAARHLKQWWYRVAVVFAGDPFKLSADAAKAFEAWRAGGGDVHDLVPRERRWDYVLDGLFGIGLTRDLSDKPAELVSYINELGRPVLAIDVPSGLEADSGRIMGRAVKAAATVTFIGLKPGLFTLDGPDHCGQVHLRTLGLDPSEVALAAGSLLDAGILARTLAPRPANSHKGTFGSLGIVGGAAGMAGAAFLAGRAAMRLGAGRVYVGVMDSSAAGFDALHPELMIRAADAVLKLAHLSALAVGPGMGQSAAAKGLLKNAIKTDLPLVLDADALNLLSQEGILRRAVIRRSAPTLLTPHPAEAGRLLGSSAAQVQHNRIEAAVELAGRLNCEVVLKGAGSVCASPNGRWQINPTGNPGLACAGQGDVLTGIVAALLAQGARAADALRAGVYLHGAAADDLVGAGIGPIGLSASEVIDAARKHLNAAIR
ncbi:MAG: NAD(P)H-hydrate dehydratase [Burkholderiales bacterium]|nr:NAD(P)H-hydrate dehydratase [Burkholderiales bacterium]